MYDKNKADRAIQFFEKYLTHTKGKWAGKPFNLLPWQKKVVSTIYGTVNTKGMRQYSTIYVEIPKKNGKSELAAGIALKGLLADGEMGAEVYSAAAEREQASIVYHVAEQMVKNNKKLRTACRIIASQKRIVVPKTSSFYKVLSAESKTKHGFNTSTAVIDELHVVDRKLYEILTQGSGDAREQPLFFIITTAGDNKNSICWELHQRALDIQNGKRNDPSFLPLVFSLDENEDWEKEENWYRVNPSMGHTITIEKMRTAYNDAKEMPSLESVFRRLRLNQWVSGDCKWLNLNDFKKCENKKIKITDFKGKDCYVAIDLSSINDITAASFTFPDYEQDKYYTFVKFYIPHENMIQRINKDKVLYDVWTREGYITETKGNIIDYNYIKNDLLDMLANLQVVIKEIAYDPYNSSQIVIDLQDEGFNMVQFRQGFLSMSPARKDFETKIKQSQFQYSTNPVLEWMADNAVILTDPAGNIKPDKNKSTERIDGIISSIMSMYRAGINKLEKSAYETEGLTIIG